MFEFHTTILKRRRVSKMALLTGFIALGILGYFAYSYFTLGFIPILTELARQIGFFDYINFVYLSSAIALFIMSIPAFRTLLKKKVVVGGQLHFDEQYLTIQDGKEKYIIPEEQLQEIEFDLLPLEEVKKLKRAGGSFIKIPTKRGLYQCEFHLEDPDKRKELMNMIQFLKIEHEVNIKIKEKK